LLNQDNPNRPRLLLLLAPADHAHRDAVCATVAWIARDEGALFECYFASATSGAHFGGNHPAYAQVADLRGGTVVGGHHLEQLSIVVLRFECEVVSLGPSPFDQFLRDGGVRFRATASNVVEFYRELLATSEVPLPERLLVVGDGGRPQQVSLSPYAFPEIFNRRLLAIADGDPATLKSLAAGRQVETLWAEPVDGAMRIESPHDSSVAAQTAWMAERHAGSRRTFLLGDPELAARWLPTAARNGWTPVFGIPQSEVIEKLEEPLKTSDVAFGRQQDDRDFLALSRLGVAFQLIDPGRPPFPVIREAPGTWPSPPRADDSPSDEQLEAWAREGRVLSTLLFWTGMVRELESLYALSDVLGLSGLRSGLILTTESFAYMKHPPLSLLNVGREAGGLFPRVETLLASAGLGAVLESLTPKDRFASLLESAVGKLKQELGDNIPRGWWPVLDCPLEPSPRSRVGTSTRPPFVRIRYRRTDVRSSIGEAGKTATRQSRLRSALRNSPARHLFEAERPFDAYRPGPPARSVLQTVSDAGFDYALTKAAGGEAPTTITGANGLTVINHTVGRWGGWTPFVTVDSLADLKRAERSLLARRRPGWLLGTLDACLWAFTGPVWRRGVELREICDLMAAGGASGRLINVAPAAVARYARVLERTGQVATIDSV